MAWRGGSPGFGFGPDITSGEWDIANMKGQMDDRLSQRNINSQGYGSMFGALLNNGYLLTNYRRFDGYGNPIGTPGFTRIETDKDRTRDLLKGYLKQYGGDKQAPELKPFSGFPTGPAVSDQSLAEMRNSMMGDSLRQAEGVNQRTARSFAARGMGDSPIMRYLQATTENQARGEGSRAGTQLAYQAGMQNADYNLKNAQAQSEAWNAYQQNLVGRYQAQNGIRNAIISAIGGLG